MDVSDESHHFSGMSTQGKGGKREGENMCLLLPGVTYFAGREEMPQRNVGSMLVARVFVSGVNCVRVSFRVRCLFAACVCGRDYDVITCVVHVCNMRHPCPLV
jgi:hypothetical protein